MSCSRWTPTAVLLGLAVFVSDAGACSLCLMSVQQSVTYREEAGRAHLVVHGTLTSSRLNADGGGTTTMRVEHVVKATGVAAPQTLTIPRYVPFDPKEPPHYLFFCDTAGSKLDAYRGVEVSAAAAEYVRGALAVDPKDRSASLRYQFNYLEHADAGIAADAFLEFAKATDKEIGEAAPGLKPEKLRAWLKDVRTPPQRLGIYAFLLGACGGAADAELFRTLLRDPQERSASSLDGILGGLIHLSPKEGWATLEAMVGDSRKPFTVRYAALRTLRFYHGWKPVECRDKVLGGMGLLLTQGEMADLAIEDLRRWKVWDLTATVLAQYAKPTHAAPIMKRAIVRYALCCPKPEAVAFVAERRKDSAEVVRDVEETLQFEKQ